MKILKFGGTSVGSAESLGRVVEIVRSHSKAPGKASGKAPGKSSEKTSAAECPIVVVSAHSGVTDELLRLARAAASGRWSLQKLRTRHRKLYREIGVDFGVVEPLLAELEDLLRGLELVGELTPRSIDLVASFGERLSARGVSAFFATELAEFGGSVAIDAWDLGLRTDSRFGDATPDLASYPAIKKALRAFRTKIPVVTGFIAKDADGNITTLGRSGSDFTATLIGAAIDADEVQIWTDVDGVMTADPRVVKAARSIPALSIAEASELAYYGAKVIHPATMLPAVERRIPVRVRNTSRPTHAGTLILRDAPSSKSGVKSIASKRGIILVTVASTRMLLQAGFMARIFEVFAKHDISVDLVATSEVTVSVTVASERNLEAVIRDLSEFSETTVERDLAQICVVGEGIRERIGAAAEVFTALKKARLPVRLISHGGTKINISFLVDAPQTAKCVRALHRAFFE